MQREKIAINPIHIGIAIVAVVFVALLVITLIQMFRPNPYGQGLRIDNFSDYVDDLPSGRRDSMFATLYKVVTENTIDGAEVPTSGALVREDSFSSNYDEAKDVHYGNFIVDIEKIRQSYQIQYEWSQDERNPNLSGYQMMALCLPMNLMIFEDFGCRDMTNAGDFDPYSSVAMRLPYYGETLSGAYLYVQIATFVSGERYLEVNVNSCGDENILGEARQYVTEWIDSIGFDAEDFVIEFRGLCDGGS